MRRMKVLAAVPTLADVPHYPLVTSLRSFKNTGTGDIFDGITTKATRKCCPQSIWPVARRKLDQINRVKEVSELQIPPGNRLEQLKGDRGNQFSIRINQNTVFALFAMNKPKAIEIKQLQPISMKIEKMA